MKTRKDETLVKFNLSLSNEVNKILRVNLYSWASTFCLLLLCIVFLSLRSCLYLSTRPQTNNQEITSLHSVVVARTREEIDPGRLDDGIRWRCNMVSTDATVAKGATFELSKVRSDPG